MDVIRERLIRYIYNFSSTIHFRNGSLSKKENKKPCWKPPVHALSDSEDDELPISVPLAARLASDSKRTSNPVTSLQRSPPAPPVPSRSEQ